MVSRERGPAEPRSMHSRSRRRRDRDRRHAIFQAQAQSYELKRFLWHRPRDDVAGATGQGDVSYVPPETMHSGCGDPPSATPSCDTSPKLNGTTNLLDGGSIDLTSSGLESISYVGRSSVDATSNTESGDPLSDAPSGYTCSKLGETAKLEVHTFASDTGNFELTGRGLESISCLGNDDPRRAAPLSYTGSKLSEDPPSATPSGYTGSKLGETVGLNTFASDTGSLDSEGSNLESIPCLGKSFTNDAPVVSPADAQASERLYQLAGIIGASETLPGTLGLWALVVDAAPCDARAMSESLLLR